MKLQDGLDDTIQAARQERFVPVVYHGGENLGLGRWATGHRHAALERAEREAARLEQQYKQQYGTAAIVEIEVH